MKTAAPLREETWDLEALYPDREAFERAKVAFRGDTLPPLDRFRGRLLESAASLADALEAVDAALEQLKNLHCYAGMRSDEDTRVAANQAAREEIRLIGTEFAKKVAYLRPEILTAEPERIEAFIAEEPRLAPQTHYLRDLMRQREHVLGQQEERILAESSLLTGEPGSLYEILTNAELPRREIALEDGKVVRLTSAEFQKHRATATRKERLAMFPLYFEAYDDFKHTLGLNLFGGLKTHLFRTRARGYSSCLAAALDVNNVPERVYRNLIRQVRDHLPVLHRYFRLRGRALGVGTPEYPDLYGPLAGKPPFSFSVAEASARVLESVAPLGETYVSALERAFASRWIDWHPREGKRSGAYANGAAYATHPYVLLNFNENYDGVTTLAHEMGHAMHSYFSNREQPFATADYSIFVAEVASTFNEALLLHNLLERAATPEVKRFLLASYLDGMRATLFRQAMFAEFELDIHERVERGEVLTGELLGEIYLKLLREYHGHDDGIVKIGEEYAVEWAAIPHFYYNFYVYQYATGIIAATALSRAVLDRIPGAGERYLAFLGSGGSDYPLELLRRAGVDLERAEPYREAFETIDRRVDQLEELLVSGGAGSTAR